MILKAHEFNLGKMGNELIGTVMKCQRIQLMTKIQDFKMIFYRINNLYLEYIYQGEIA